MALVYTTVYIGLPCMETSMVLSGDLRSIRVEVVMLFMDDELCIKFSHQPNSNQNWRNLRP